MKRSKAKRIRRRLDSSMSHGKRGPAFMGKRLPFYIAPNGKPITMGDWAIRHERRQQDGYILHHFCDGGMVSTAWIGMGGPFACPFETMIFPAIRTPQDQKRGAFLESYSVRYRTWTDARKGHVHAIKLATGRPLISLARPGSHTNKRGYNAWQ